MKKTLFVAGGILALGVLCYVGRLWAQPNPPASPSAQKEMRTKVALINLTYVIKNYTKYINFHEDIKKAIQPFQDTDKKLREQAEKLTKTPPEPGKREEVEHELKELQRKIEDNNTAAKTTLGRKSDEQMKILYMDVVAAAQGYARSHDFDLVLHYNDATTEPDFFSPQNIARKLQSGALMPLYAAGGMDISAEVVNMLNYNLRPTTTSQGAPPNGGAAAGH